MNALFQGWVCRFGVPAVITTYRVPQFTSSLWAALCYLLPARQNDSIPQDGRTLPLPPKGCTAVPLRSGKLGLGPGWPPHRGREGDDTTPAQAVFISPLILSGQFLDSPGLPSENFCEQFSKTLSAAEHPATGHNTAAARQPSPKLPDALARTPTVFVWQDNHVHATPAALQRLLRRSLHHFTLRIGYREDKVSSPPSG